MTTDEKKAFVRRMKKGKKDAKKKSRKYSGNRPLPKHLRTLEEAKRSQKIVKGASKRRLEKHLKALNAKLRVLGTQPFNAANKKKWDKLKSAQYETWIRIGDWRK